MFKTPILMLKMTFFWLLFCGKFEQKTQKSISFKNQWRLKNIKKAMVVKNIIAEDMPFTKSIFEQFWRSYCKKTIFVVFHFLKFLPFCNILTLMLKLLETLFVQLLRRTPVLGFCKHCLLGTPFSWNRYQIRTFGYHIRDSELQWANF